jgi:hypothetical protein
MKEQMKFFVGVVPDSHNMGEDTYFTHNGLNYYFAVTLQDDHVYLEDTVGRSIPIDLECLQAMSFVFDKLDTFVYAQQDAMAHLEEDVRTWNSGLVDWD